MLAFLKDACCYPSIIFCLFGWVKQQQQTKQRGPDLPLLIHLLQLSWEDTKMFPGQPRNIISTACTRSAPGLSRSDMPETSPQGNVKEASWLHARTTSICLSWCSRACAQMTELLIWSIRVIYCILFVVLSTNSVCVLKWKEHVFAVCRCDKQQMNCPSFDQ